jgi:pimeloyl-ACP methyl ester carboxylesterase
MYRELMPELADRYHVMAPDLPGFGFTEVRNRTGFTAYLRSIGRIAASA